jgi:hypothetical protein
MGEEVAEEHGGQRGGAGGVTTTASSIRPDRVKIVSSCARLDSRWRLSLHGHRRVPGELYYFFFGPAAVVLWITIASAYEGAVASVG